MTRTEPIDESALLGYSNSMLDILFRQSASGPIPDGDTRGTLLGWPGTSVTKPLAWLVRVLIWQGKVLDRREGVLRNKLTPFGLRLVKARLSIASSWVDNGDCVLIDYSTTSFLARMVRDEIRQVGPGLYLGVVWLWRKRIGWFTIRSTG
ncbi:hypothetical protein [Mycolicibacterium neworleansense]|uniref:Uncharacterized protein n=1 Tax=Mycolicibacterium neworleansense TaxID=146018 RepID=A0A0H5RV38_9MYCO|nr:hypothetical protein [Mycolicibacterium neworleansense]MCV7362894.1 hypothetical protein [Mycolicibacterium neworleansense]CRZ17641.1 hypothetical protein BN2156_04531 [Mycolicibacterium neworleansense]